MLYKCPIDSCNYYALYKDNAIYEIYRYKNILGSYEFFNFSSLCWKGGSRKSMQDQINSVSKSYETGPISIDEANEYLKKYDRTI